MFISSVLADQLATSRPLSLLIVHDAQDDSGRLKPLPEEEEISSVTGSRRRQPSDPNLAAAIRAQQEELDRVRASNRTFQPLEADPYGGTPPPPEPSPWQQFWREVCSPVTLLSLLVTAAFLSTFLVSLALEGWTIEELELNPWIGPTQAGVLSVGAQATPLVKGLGEWWRLFSSPFVSSGVVMLLLALSALWTYGRYLSKTMPMPAASVPGVFLAGAFMGAATSANLNTKYVSCGAMAGPCALLGGVWAEHLIHWRNVPGHYLNLAVLTVITGVMIVVSLLPLADVWYQAAALLTGLLLSLIIILLPKVSRKRRRRGMSVRLHREGGIAV
jgi:membrane associated rhomboid family serine protease